MLRKTKRVKEDDSRGFTLIEVLISMFLTIVVMGAVFALLTRGQKSFEREPQVADMQQSARAALDMVSKDILQAGAGLPPEYPSITPKSVDASVGDQGAGPDVLEIIGASAAPGQVSPAPEPVINFDGTTVTIGQSQTVLQPGDLVVLYNDDPQNGDWVTLFVATVTQNSGANESQVTLGDPVTFGSPSVTRGIPGGTNYSQTDTPYNWTTGSIMRVTVVRYLTQIVDGDLILMRQVNWEPPMPVGMIDDFQIAYLIPNIADPNQLDPVPDPPHPHPTMKDGQIITPQDIIAGVRVTVAARSRDENLEGSTVGASGNYIRKTF